MPSFTEINQNPNFTEMFFYRNFLTVIFVHRNFVYPVLIPRGAQWFLPCLESFCPCLSVRKLNKFRPFGLKNAIRVNICQRICNLSFVGIFDRIRPFFFILG